MQKNIKYRPDIDGLRAIAVLSVLVFHFNDSWLTGGFLGVDVFFVISGYLITLIIKKQIAEGRFSFKVFYTRRIKRILPLFFTVLLVTFVFAVFILMPEDYRNFWRSARYAMQFRANRAFTGSDYFDLATEEKPLLHLWSLAIEEQFYFIWPLVLLGTFFVVKRFQNPFVWAFWMAILGVILSTILAEISINDAPENSYYLLQNRAAELLVGCALALNPYSINKAIKPYLGFAGVLILIGCFILFDSSVPFPGLYALIPTIAAALFIYDDEHSVYKKFFTNTIVRTIGLWSFSLYLWHWPILAFMRYLHNGIELTLPWIVFAALLTTILSIFSYYLVENPVRKTKLNFIKSLIIIYLIPMSLMTSFNALIGKKEDFITTEQSRWFDRDDDGCWNKILSDCSVGDKSSDIRYLLIGDSHAMHLSKLMDLVGKKEAIKIDVIASPGCPVYFNYQLEVGKIGNCLEINQFFEKNWDQYDGIIISQLYDGYIGNNGIDNGSYLNNVRNTIFEVGKKKDTIFISDIPAYNYDPVRDIWFDRNYILKEFTNDDGFNHNFHYANQKIDNLIVELNSKNIRYIDITPYIFDLLDQKEIIYRDVNHLNPYGSRLLGELFIQNQNLLLEKDLEP